MSRRASGRGSDNRDGVLMDTLIAAGAHALAAGGPLGAVEGSGRGGAAAGAGGGGLVALRQSALRAAAPARALRGIARAKLANFVRARRLLRRAARAFPPS